MQGALPCFETFGNMPTNLVKEDGLVDNKPISEILDMLIIPGGSLIESGTIKGQLEKEILKMADNGKFVLGICSGFQVLANGTDIGRLSATPIIRKGLGLIDTEITPLICTDQVKASIINSSYLTDSVGSQVRGFHCHTYGNLALHKNAKPIMVSHTQRVDYFKDRKELISGVSNQKGNVVGVYLHALLDNNPLIIEGICKSLNINQAELSEIKKKNSKLQKQMKSELGILTNIHIENKPSKNKPSRSLLITALGSESGKTFIVTGIAGALKKKGINVGIVKIGGDIRDAVPALYLIKEPMKEYSSIIIGKSGWKSPFEAINQASKDYELVIIEGAMSAFTGLLNEQIKKPSSTAEVAASLGAPTIVIAGASKEGVEGALVSTLNYVKLLKTLGVKTVGVILNKVHTSYLSEDLKELIKQTYENAGVELLGIVPYVNLEGRGAIPEIEIKYEEFCTKAVETAETSIDIKRITEVAAPSVQNQTDYEALVKKFKTALKTDFKANN